MIYEVISQYLLNESPEYSYFAIAVMAVSMIINKIMARMKFAVGNRENSISLTADGKHSRADVITSLRVLIALLITLYFTYADSIVDVLVGVKSTNGPLDKLI